MLAAILEQAVAQQHEAKVADDAHPVAAKAPSQTVALDLSIPSDPTSKAGKAYLSNEQVLKNVEIMSGQAQETIGQLSAFLGMVDPKRAVAKGMTTAVVKGHQKVMKELTEALKKETAGKTPDQLRVESEIWNSLHNYDGMLK